MPLMTSEDLLNPIREDMPIGDDVLYDDDFSLLKEKRKEQDENSLGVWKEKKSAAELESSDNRSAVDICCDILKNKSKNFQVLAFLIEDLTKTKNLQGLCEGLSLLIPFCAQFWETAYPIFEPEEQSIERNKILRWIDEKTVFSLRHSSLIKDILKSHLSFDDIEKLNNTGFYSKNKNHNISKDDLIKIKLSLQKLKPQIIEEHILPQVEECQSQIAALKEILSEKNEVDPDSFFHLSDLLREIHHFFNGLLAGEQVNGQGELESVNDNVGGLLGGDRDGIYANIQALTEQLLQLDPHSPVPHFIFKTLTWKDKSFLEIVADLGLSSPLFDFLNQAKQQSQIGRYSDDD